MFISTPRTEILCIHARSGPTSEWLRFRILFPDGEGFRDGVGGCGGCIGSGPPMVCLVFRVGRVGRAGRIWVCYPLHLACQDQVCRVCSERSFPPDAV